MRIDEEDSGGVRILRFAGEFDAQDVPEIARRLEAASSAGAVRLVLNLEEVSFATASVLGCLVEARAHARKREGDLVLSTPSKPVGRVLRRLGLDRVLRAYRSDDDAIRDLGAGRGVAGSVARARHGALPRPCLSGQGG